MARVTIIVPCYNEAARLDRTPFATFACEGHDVRFLFVDDGSTDATMTLLQSITVSNPQKFSILTLPQNKGKAEAVRRGFLRAFESHPDYVGFWDADLATPLNAIPMFLELAEANSNIQIVIGSRVKLLGRQIERRPARHYLGRVFATAVSVTLGLAIYDSQCGAKIFRVSQPIKDLFTTPFVSRWIFDVEIIARLIKSTRADQVCRPEKAIYELPLLEWRDVRGSKVKGTDFVKAALELIRIYYCYVRTSELPFWKSQRSY